MKTFGTADWARELERRGELLRVRAQLSSDLELAALQRRLFRKGAPAVLVEHVEGSRFPAMANLYGTEARMKALFAGADDALEMLFAAHADPKRLLLAPKEWPRALRALADALPRGVGGPTAPWNALPFDRIPGLRCWPEDGGRFWTLPQALTEDPDRPGWRNSNLGMYRVQVDGNDYVPGVVGMHYQVHRGIGLHHRKAIAKGVPLKVSVALGGHPAHALAAVMPLPEGIPEIALAGVLARRRFRLFRKDGFLQSADADFVLNGLLFPDDKLPEGPFGDHMGYYSMRHPMPALRLSSAWAREDAVFPFTVVGRPPREDSLFGAFVHRITSDLVPASLPGVRAVNAVDEAGVHPLLLAVGSERDVPYESVRPRELLTQAMAVLGFGQLSLAKVLVIADGSRGDAPDPRDVPAFLRHALERADWRRDLHFVTNCAADTLDYTGGELHAGSKCVWAVAGDPVRSLASGIPPRLPLPDGFSDPRPVFPGVFAVRAPKWTSAENADREISALGALWRGAIGDGFTVAVLCDDSERLSSSGADALWGIFTRIDPAHDVRGVGESVEAKHWGCEGALILDARSKPHHAPELVPDEKAEERVDRLFAPGGPFYGM